ncbi:MAG: DUF2096 family protein [Candidatus Bathyarchaeia archaeon]
MSDPHAQAKIYDDTWKVLADLITALRGKGLEVPSNIMVDLRSARVMINVYKADPAATAEVIPKIEAYLKSVEGNLVHLAESTLGSRFVEAWLERLSAAQAGLQPAAPPKKPRFIPGLPRHGRWLRMKVLEPGSLDVIERVAVETGLSTELQNDGYVMIHGDHEDIKKFVRKIAKETTTR